MKIELVGGPHCGTVLNADAPSGMVHRTHVQQVGKEYTAKYTRTGLRTSTHHARYDYVGQIPLLPDTSDSE